MRISILGWSYNNIRGVNNLEVSLEKQYNDPYHVSLIMMPNGTGKTTTQTLLRAIFDGNAEMWSKEEVLDFSPPSSDNQRGEFQATLLIDEKIHKITIHLDYHTGIASYSTARVGDQGGLEPGHNIPALLKSTFTEEFVKRFVFDGELAKEIIGKESEEAERTIRYLYQLNRLPEMRNRIDEIVKVKQKEAEKKTTAKTEQSLNKFKFEEDSLKKTHIKLTRKKKSLERDIKHDQDRLNEIKNEKAEHIKSDDNLRKRAEEIEKKQSEVESKANQSINYIQHNIRNPYLLSKKLSEQLSGLANKMTELKLPKTMSKQFFEDLSHHDKCICGREIGHAEKEHILNCADDYLAEDQIGVINAIKTTIRDRNYSEDLKEEINNLSSTLSDRNKLKQDWDRIQTERISSGDSKLEELELEENLLTERVRSNNDELKTLTTKDLYERRLLDSGSNITICEQELESIREKIMQVSETLSLHKRAKKLKDLLLEVEDTTLHKLKERIKNETNIKLSQIIKDEPILVEDIEGSLKLKHKAGASEGQSLAIAYSFLGSMFETSSYTLPFIVDTPAGPLDLSVRHEISSILPNLFEQLIIFITSGEREGFTENFMDSDNVQFMTIHRESNHTKCVIGREYFESFQSVEVNSKAEERV